MKTVRKVRFIGAAIGTSVGIIGTIAYIFTNFEEGLALLAITFAFLGIVIGVVDAQSAESRLDEQLNEIRGEIKKLNEADDYEDEEE